MGRFPQIESHPSCGGPAGAADGRSCRLSCNGISRYATRFRLTHRGRSGSLRACSAPAAEARSPANPSSVPPAVSISWPPRPVHAIATGALQETDLVREALAAEYEIIEELGRGGMAMVYRARDRQLEREVAIKVLPFSLAFDAEFVERFQREARTAAQLEHPNIIPIYRVGRSGRVIYFVMKFLRGGSLSTVLRRAEEAHPARDPPAPARGRQRARLCGPARHRAPRHQARQHHVRRVRAVRAHRLRHRQGGVGPEAHRHRHVHRHAALHEPRAGAGAGRSTAGATSTAWASWPTSASPARCPTTARTASRSATSTSPSRSRRRQLITADERRIFEVIKRMLMKDPADRFQSCEELVASIQGQPIAAPGSGAGARPRPSRPVRHGRACRRCRARWRRRSADREPAHDADRFAAGQPARDPARTAGRCRAGWPTARWPCAAARVVLGLALGGAGGARRRRRRASTTTSPTASPPASAEPTADSAARLGAGHDAAGATRTAARTPAPPGDTARAAPTPPRRRRRHSAARHAGCPPDPARRRRSARRASRRRRRQRRHPPRRAAARLDRHDRRASRSLEPVTRLSPGPHALARLGAAVQLLLRHDRGPAGRDHRAHPAAHAARARPPLPRRERATGRPTAASRARATTPTARASTSGPSRSTRRSCRCPTSVDRRRRGRRCSGSRCRPRGARWTCTRLRPSNDPAFERAVRNFVWTRDLASGAQGRRAGRGLDPDALPAAAAVKPARSGPASIPPPSSRPAPP